MKILVLLTDLFDAIGGIQTFNRALVKALDQIGVERGWAISVLVLNDKGRTADSANYCTPGRTAYRGFSGSKPWFLKAAMSEACDASTVIVGHVNFAPMVLGLLARNSHLQILLTIFGIDVWSKLSKLQRMGLSKVDRILSISKSTRDRMAAVNDLNGTPVDILPCTLQPFYGLQVQLKSREELGLPAGKMILSTSRLEAGDWYKGIEEVIAAMPAVLTNVPDAFYVVVGDGADRARLEKLAAEQGIRDNVYFTGRVEDQLLCSYYQSCEVFVLPSTREGFGIVFLEAMYYGKPCVGARAGATPEVIEDGVTGLLTDPKDFELLARILTRLLLDEKLMTSMGSFGLDRLRNEFSFERFRGKLENYVCA